MGINKCPDLSSYADQDLRSLYHSIWVDCIRTDPSPGCTFSATGLPIKTGDTIRAVFEYPKGSNQFFNVFDTHGNCNYDRAFPWVRSRQDTFRQDLAQALVAQGRSPESIRVFPPLFFGDVNSLGWDPSCGANNGATAEAFRNQYFYPAGDFDAVWVGKTKDMVNRCQVGYPRAPRRIFCNDLWDYDLAWQTVGPVGSDYCLNSGTPSDQQFQCGPFGYTLHPMTGYINRYSDHSPSMVVFGWDPAPDQTEPNDNFQAPFEIQADTSYPLTCHARRELDYYLVRGLWSQGTASAHLQSNMLTWWNPSAIFSRLYVGSALAGWTPVERSQMLSADYENTWNLDLFGQDLLIEVDCAGTNEVGPYQLMVSVQDLFPALMVSIARAAQ